MADHKSRSQSPPPSRDATSRRRSRSPRSRDDRDRPRDKPRGGGGGFKWKDNKRRDNNNDDGKEKRLERGYRNRSRSPRRDRDRERDRESKGNSVEDKFGVADKFGLSSSSSSSKPKSDSQGEKEGKKEKAAAAPVAQPTGEAMIIVHVNDRLGTKAAIPCLASDPIKLFKAQVAARIGRQPHEILLKRQGERPFKDQLTLEDYGVSNGVQIDLEIDTGDLLNLTSPHLHQQLSNAMLTTQPHLRTRRPSPTTVEYTVSTYPSLTLPLRLLLLLAFLLRLTLGLSVLLLLYSKYLLSTFSSTPKTYNSPPEFPSIDYALFLLGHINTSSLGLLFTRLAASIPAVVIVPSSIVVLYMLTLRLHTTESLLVLRGLGIQTSTSSVTYLSSATTRFIPTEKIQDILVNEAFRGFEVRYYLVVVVEGEEQVVVVFPRLLPRRGVVETVWRGGRGVLFEPGGGCGKDKERGY
ncbi:Phosphatidylinositol N-acetylglucosaminyltransferase subunit gpi15 [Lachnellula hyalina]|uniref:Ubiquitin-like modifier HUB1 n=1 Tax=Lachnellula hyalina TaxID=1316788 RepID=A0A8H8R0P3_9HELO|nr:Phosphatidylinositol N-acetylglucosaminyltransferase subunit gpi15 [Lachnellula hyalina]TVY25536.1 Phosphatidylinositol N-acetylglucosaminyltransferase subunit gpi15 [Lachnellula hyalina]